MSIRGFLVLLILGSSMLPHFASSSFEDKGLDGLPLWLEVIGRATEVNEAFKHAVADGRKGDASQLRLELEACYEEEFLPLIPQLKEYVSMEQDLQFAGALLRMAVSYQNSADESLADLLGVLCARNPGLLLRAGGTLSAGDKLVVNQLVEYGVKNLPAGSPQDVAAVISGCSLR